MVYYKVYFTEELTGEKDSELQKIILIVDDAGKQYALVSNLRNGGKFEDFPEPGRVMDIMKRKEVVPIEKFGITFGAMLRLFIKIYYEKDDPVEDMSYNDYGEYFWNALNEK